LVVPVFYISESESSGSKSAATKEQTILNIEDSCNKKLPGNELLERLADFGTATSKAPQPAKN